ncbi:MAG: type II toxin-antitoxin system VapB family antitoxin [Armatimonadetes bacterium]|nr:type II toxin-antitoxin system VapB family antitoxin [Armatimonadota bacterium]
MASNIKYDEALMDQALKISGLKTKREVVNEALRGYIQRKGQLEFLKLRGTIDIDPTYDYKEQRRRR